MVIGWGAMLDARGMSNGFMVSSVIARIDSGMFEIPPKTDDRYPLTNG